MIVFLVVAALAAVGAAYYLNRPADGIPTEGVIISVKAGESLDDIAGRLQAEGAIRSPVFLKVLSRLRSTEGSFKVGSYRVEHGTSTLGVHDILVSGSEVLYKVTIPEGWTLARIADILQAESIVDAAAFISAASSEEILQEFPIAGASVEGFLYPDTYLFPRDFPADQVVRHMVEQFFEVISEIYPGYVDTDPKELYEKVTLASIIEREYRAKQEAPLMASVFYNRLAADMRLQSCATVAYVLTEVLGREHPESLTYDDLEVDSDYNTYARWGLPPGPIANPGAVALDAVFHPAQSEYLYFVLRDFEGGQHEFSSSLDDHNYAKFLYLKKR